MPAILDLPFACTMSCIPPGKSGRQYYEVQGTAPFQVPEATSDEAPVSCTYGRVEYRSFEGRSYRKVGVDVAALQARLPSCRKNGHPWMEDPFDAVISPVFPRKCSPAHSPFGRKTEAETLAGLVAEAKRGRAVRDVKDDAPERIEDARKAWSRGLLLVDGEPWVVATEPHYRLEYQGGRAVRLTVDTEPSREARWSLPFRADRHADAVEYGKRMAASVRGRFFIDECDRQSSGLDVVDPEALAFDEAGAMAAAILDETTYNFWPREASWERHGVTFERSILDARRRDGDPGWGRDFMDIPGLAKMVEYGCARDYAKDRDEWTAACRISIDAWHGFFRERLVVPEPEVEEDLGAYMAM